MGPVLDHELILLDGLGKLVARLESTRFAKRRGSRLGRILGRLLDNLVEIGDRFLQVRQGHVAVIGQIRETLVVVLRGGLQPGPGRSRRAGEILRELNAIRWRFDRLHLRPDLGIGGRARPDDVAQYDEAQQASDDRRNRTPEFHGVFHRAMGPPGQDHHVLFRIVNHGGNLMFELVPSRQRPGCDGVRDASFFILLTSCRTAPGWRNRTIPRNLSSQQS